MVAEKFEVEAIGHVIGGRTEAIDDHWGPVEAKIELDERFEPDSLDGLADFSHLDVVYVFHALGDEPITSGARHPRGRTDWPKVGIFAQRAKARPNAIGVSTCEIVRVEGRCVFVRGLDAIDGSPVIDIKPHVIEMGPRSDVHEPPWVVDLMSEYWDA